MLICKYNFLIFRNSTPKKIFSSEYFNTIISPVKEFVMKPFLDSPYIQNNINIPSADNLLKFNSPMNSKSKYYLNYFLMLFLI